LRSSDRMAICGACSTELLSKGLEVQRAALGRRPTNRIRPPACRVVSMRSSQEPRIATDAQFDAGPLDIGFDQFCKHKQLSNLLALFRRKLKYGSPKKTNRRNRRDGPAPAPGLHAGMARAIVLISGRKRNWQL